jgi:hypothetical protein
MCPRLLVAFVPPATRQPRPPYFVEGGDSRESVEHSYGCLLKALRNFQEINYPSCGVGILPALNIGTGGDTHPTRKFGIFFYLEVPKTTTVHLCK